MTTHDATAAGTPVPGRLLAGRYRLGPRRGSGLDIAIFEAIDEREHRPVAVKVVHPDLCAAAGFLDRFEDTMLRSASVVHPNIARLLDWGIADWDGRTVVFTAAENLTGGSLRDLIDRGRTLSPSQGLMVGLDVCKALDAAHRAGLVHGDVRPANLVFGTDGKVRITDLGLAHLVSEPMWADPTSVPISRARFASPEQARGREVGQKSDVYALALSLLEAMTGMLPFVGDSTVATLANRVDRLLPVSADLGPLAAVLERAARPDPEDRWSAAEFGRALVQAAEKLPRPAPLPLLGAGLFADAPPATTSIPVVAPPATGGSVAAPVGPSAGETAAAAAAPSPQPSGPLVEPVEPNLLSHVPVATTAPAVVLPTEPLPPPATDPQSVTVAAVAPSAAAVPSPTAAVPVVAPVATGPVAIPPPPTREPPLLREKRSRRKLALVVVVVLLAIAAGGALAWFLTRDQPDPVPELVGLEQGAALNEISEFDWQVTVTEEASDDVAAGIVIRTDPEAGVELSRGDEITLVVSSGPAPRVLPEIAGLTVEQATTLLVDLGLTLQLGGEEFSEDVPSGTIISWQVPAQPMLVAGDTVVRGTAIVVIRSSGPAPRTVPDLTGFDLATATAQLEGLGLVVSQLPDEFSADVPAGGVARQEPAPGTEIARGGVVTIAISKGPDLVTVPPLAELTVDEVRAALDEAGLVLGEVLGDPDGLAVLAEVDGESLAANVPLPRGTAIDVTFEVPPPPTTVPPSTTVPPETTTG